MEQLGQLLGVAGFFGIIVAIFVGSMVLAVIPIWAIIDCLMRDDEDTAKLIGAAVIFITWSFGGFFYALFITKTSILRIVTIISVVVIGVGGFLSAGACLTGAAIHGKASYEKEQARRKELVANYRPDIVSPSFVGEFFGLKQEEGTNTVYSYDLKGKQKTIGSFGAKRKLKHLAYNVDGGESYAASDYKLYRLASSAPHKEGPHYNAPLEDIDIIENPNRKRYRFNGLVYDKRNNRLVVCCHYAFNGYLFSYDLEKRVWSELKNGKKYLFHALASSPDGRDIYGVKVENKAISTLTRMDPLGNILTSTKLDTEIPVLQRKHIVQATWSQGYVVLILGGYFRYADRDKAAPIAAIEPNKGSVLAASIAAFKGLEKSK